MSTGAVVVYTVIALAGFAWAIRRNLGMLATAVADDPLDAAFLVFALFCMSVAWPLTACVFAALGLCYLLIRLVVAVTTR